MTQDLPRFTFQKTERLKSKKIINQLFDKRQSKSKVIYPFRIVWIETPLPSTFPVQFMVSVPKRFISKAHNRNLIKRQVREAYRQNKHRLYACFPTTPVKEESNSAHSTPTIQVALMFIYLGKQTLPYSLIYGKLCACIRYLSKQYLHSNQ